MISKVPSCAFSGFWTLNWKLTQHFDLIYNVGKSDWNILRNIMKTAQDSYTITIKQIVRLQERMHLEKFKVDKIQNGRPSAILNSRSRRFERNKNVSSPSTCESQYCGEPPWPGGSVLGLRPPGLEFRILCLKDSVISIMSPSSGGSPGPV